MRMQEWWSGINKTGRIVTCSILAVLGVVILSLIISSGGGQRLTSRNLIMALGQNGWQLSSHGDAGHEMVSLEYAKTVKNITINCDFVGTNLDNDIICVQFYVQNTDYIAGLENSWAIVPIIHEEIIQVMEKFYPDAINIFAEMEVDLMFKDSKNCKIYKDYNDGVPRINITNRMGQYELSEIHYLVTTGMIYCLNVFNKGK